MVQKTPPSSAKARAQWVVLGACLCFACSSDDAGRNGQGTSAGGASSGNGAGTTTTSGGDSTNSTSASVGGAAGTVTGSGGGQSGTTGTVSSSMGGAAGSMGGAASTDGQASSMGGSGNGGDAGSAAVTTGGAGAGGTGGGVWACPAGVTDTPALDGTPTRIASVPPPDSFNMDNGTFGNIEGPVWTGDALYVSEMGAMPYDQQNSQVTMSRILKVTPDGQTTIAVADSGSNGLALDADGSLLAAVHKDGSISRITLPDGTVTPIVTSYMDSRFDSPNDLAIHSTGTIYFTDPSFQAPSTPPQQATRVYRVPPGGAAEPLGDMFNNPNGITLSLAEDYLYVAASVGRRYPVMADGALGTGEDWTVASGGDGMVIDCAGNLYVAMANSANVVVSSPEGTMIGTITVPDIQAVTNVAFGGADHQTLYITGLGNNKGLFELPMNLPGRPY